MTAPKTANGSELLALLEQKRLDRISDDSRMQCKVCWYIYDPARGCPETQTPPGTPFKALPSWWCCPGCGNTQEVFILSEDPGYDD